MARNHRRKQTRRSGTAIVELAICLTFLIMPTLVGVLEVARMVEASQVITNAAREGARRGATGGTPGTPSNPDIVAFVNMYLVAAKVYTTPTKLPTVPPVVTITINPSGAADASDANPGSLPNQTPVTQPDTVSVQVDVALKDVRWVKINYFAFATDATMMSAKVTWPVMKDLTLPLPPTPQGW